jgi:hypothetical protein
MMQFQPGYLHYQNESRAKSFIYLFRFCCVVVVVYEAKQEAELDTLTEPRSNPFKFKSGEVMTGESRKFDRSGKTQRKRKIKQDLEQYKEDDLNADLRKGKKLLNHHES